MRKLSHHGVVIEILHTERIDEFGGKQIDKHHTPYGVGMLAGYQANQPSPIGMALQDEILV